MDVLDTGEPFAHRYTYFPAAWAALLKSLPDADAAELVADAEPGAEDGSTVPDPAAPELVGGILRGGTLVSPVPAAELDGRKPELPTWPDGKPVPNSNW